MNMKLNTLTKLMKWFSAISLACAATSLVGVPYNIDYNGSLADDMGVLLDGDYYIKFAIAPESPADASEIYWSSAPWDDVLGEPDAALEVPVTQGVFSTVLEGVDSTVLGNPDLTLHVWISDVVDGTYEYLGATPINSVPYAVVAGYAEGVDASSISGELDGALLAAGSVDEDALGTLTLSLTDNDQLDGNGNGIPGEPEDVEISIANILRSISENSAIKFDNLPGRSDYEVYLRQDVPVGFGGSGTFIRPFPLTQPFELNGGLMPTLAILDGDGNDITGDGTSVPGLVFSNTTVDLDFDGFAEPQMQVSGTPTTVGTFPVRVRGTTRWGEPFVVVYDVIVSSVDIDQENRVRGHSSRLGGAARDASVGANLIPEVGGDDVPFDVYGGDPVWFSFTSEEALADHIVVQWTVPNPNGGTMTVNIPGDAGRTFYVNSPGADGMGSSQGVIHLDEDPFNADISHTGTYAASILFDWGQALTVGADSLDNIWEGFILPENSIRYGSGAGLVNLFDRFTDSNGYLFGDENLTGQYFGASPAPDTLFGLLNTAEAGEVDKYLQGYDPFDYLAASGSAGAAYIRGTAFTHWIQSKVQRVDSTSAPTVYIERGLNVVETDSNFSGDLIGDPWLALDGFGPLDGSGDLLGSAFPALGQGLISDNNNMRGTYNYPQDGSPLTFVTTSPGRPIVAAVPGTNTDSATLVSADDKLYFWYNSILIVTYWTYIENGFIDSIGPMTAIFEVGDNINIVNDLIDTNQVAGYSANVGGDFGTTNGRYFMGLYPLEADNPSNKVAHGVNNVAYVWNAVGGGSGFEFVNENLGNTIVIPGSSMVNVWTASDSTVDFSFNLDVDSGFSSEGTSANVFVRSDIVIYDFYVQEVDLSLDRGNPAFIVQGDDTTQAIVIDQGDDLMITLQAYIRPALFNIDDDGDLTDGLERDLNARFFLTPSLTGSVRVEITNNITEIVDDVTGIDADSDLNHVPAGIENRVLVTWEVILENPLQAIAQTNVATGYISAWLSSMVDGATVNTVSTYYLDSNAIAPYVSGLNAVDGVLETMVDMPLNPTIVGPGGGLTITVNPIP
jgi:hypothetical protein